MSKSLLWLQQHKGSSLAIGTGALLLIGWFILTSSSPESSPSYIQDVQPILASKCYACHGPDEAKREAGLRLDMETNLYDTLESGLPAISLDHYSESELIQRITSVDPSYQMPPPDFPKPLEADEIHIIRQWVERGAKWENHWSLEPIQAPHPPTVRGRRWVKNPIDQFILAKQKDMDLNHSPLADKQTLIRRLSFDLHGLPPNPGEVEAFLSDESEDAYEQLVDRLLSSARYGERWARHWLDIVHYGETHGYDKDQRRYHAWPYRDYVIKALNQDIPYSRFVEDQIAGDVLYPDQPQSTVALGFLAAGPWDLVGHVEVKDGTVDKRIVRNLDRDDMVSSTVSTFTGLTVQCARCHDHKFDPIRQSDYYRLQAVFAGIDRADRVYDEDPEVHKKRQSWLRQKKQLQQQFEALDALTDNNARTRITQSQTKQKQLEKNLNQLNALSSKTFGYHSLIETTADIPKWIEIDLGDSYPLSEVVLVPGHKGIRLTMPGYGFPLKFGLDIAEKADFSDAERLVDFTEHEHHERTDRPFIAKANNSKARYIRLTVNRLWKGKEQDHFLAMAEIQAFSKGKNVARAATVTASDQLLQPKWHPDYLTDGFNSWRIIAGEPLPFPQRNQKKQAEAQLRTLRNEEHAFRREGLEPDQKQELDALRESMNRLSDSLTSLPEPGLVYAAATDFSPQFRFTPADSIRPIHRLNRGDTEQPLEEVGPGTVETFKQLESQFALAEGHTEGDRRAALARWMTSEYNAFTWRSIVNRVWQYHFGKGIVPTPNDFGKMGIPPSHPELLDYLASEFLNNGQSLKWLHKLIVMSATYQQQSSSDAHNQLIDNDNRYLWRANRRQLEAEAVRDAVLAASGKLNLRMGGPGFDPFKYEDDHSPRYLYKDYNPHDPSTFRRAIYRSITRTVPDPFMTTLDCADPSQSVPVRNETVTALQALSALNNPFMVRQADFFAERLKEEAEGTEAQIDLAFRLALQRLPTEEERASLLQYTDKHSLSASCRLIFAMNEFLYVD
ncbi:MAG: PSD1 and planctomycete cytochrome C domain-containing protein [Bacteroidota bacterium]